MNSIDKIFEVLIKKLEAIDSKITDIHSLSAPYKLDDVELANILLEAFERVADRHFRLVILSVLARSKVSFDGMPLARVFDSSADQEAPRWEICDVVSYGKANGVGPWIINQLKDRSLGKDREMLCIAAARALPKAVACQLLKDVFLEFPAHAAIGLGLCGGSAELDFLREKATSITGWQKKTIQSKGIRRIERRLATQAKGK